MSTEELTYFRTRSGSVFTDHSRDQFGADVTPVVVIDPEDGERVEAIVASARTFDRSAGCRAVRNLLRSWTKPVAPPKPDEPTGFGAGVRDREGTVWLCVLPNSDQPWCDRDGRWRAWDEIDVPEGGVLFEGVEP